MVPEAEFTSYYGQPILNPPVWKVPDVPAYLFLGGMAGASALMAELAAARGHDQLRRAGRITASVGALGGTVALVHDLGRPERFLNMLRVFKPTSPLSVGSWTLSAFAGLSTVATVAEVSGRWRALGRLAGLGAAALGPLMATYTAALLANTAVPAWSEARRELPLTFAGSAMASAAAAGMIAPIPLEQRAPTRRLAVVGAAVELTASTLTERRLGLVAEAYRTGRPGKLLRASRVLTALGVLGGLASRRSRAGSLASGLVLAAGALTARFGIFDAGKASALDPKYVVVPQKERLAARRAGTTGTAGTAGTGTAGTAGTG